MSESNILVYLLRRDLRVSDNPILSHLASSGHGFSHLLPVYVFPAHQMELSGFVRDGKENPYPEARSMVGGYWRCGPHRAKFTAEAVWDMKESLESLGSGLAIRFGMLGDVTQHVLEELHGKNYKVGAVWLTGEEGVEEKRDEKAISAVCEKEGADFKLWVDEKYFIDDRDLNFEKPSDLPDVFTTYRKSAEPLREKPRPTLPKPERSTLPPFPGPASIPAQPSPFVVPDSYEALEEGLLKPIKNFMPDLPAFPDNATSAHPFTGGESSAQARLEHLLQSGGMRNYKETRNSLMGTEFSTKLSGYLALGCLTARQIHEALAGYEDGVDDRFEGVEGYGGGENEDTEAVRFELLWRDYMRLCTKKFKHKLFRLDGFRGEEKYKENEEKKPQWKSANKAEAAPDQSPGPEAVAKILERFNAGTTGMGIIDASQRELLHTGYTSNRARQNVASFLAKHLGVDWRYGAEWYEMLLTDYDVSSNWANWQYVSGVGNDPRGEARIFNPVKQAFDYDKDGVYVRSWVPEVGRLKKLENVFQAWTASEEDLREAGLEGHPMATDPVKRIEFTVEGKPKNSKRHFVRRRGGNGQRAGNSDGEAQPSAQEPAEEQAPPSGPRRQAGRGRAGGGESSRGASRGGRGGGGYRGRGYYSSRGYRGRHHGPPPGGPPPGGPPPAPSAPAGPSDG